MSRHKKGPRAGESATEWRARSAMSKILKKKQKKSGSATMRAPTATKDAGKPSRPPKHERLKQQRPRALNARHPFKPAQRVLVWLAGEDARFPLAVHGLVDTAVTVCIPASSSPDMAAALAAANCPLICGVKLDSTRFWQAMESFDVAVCHFPPLSHKYLSHEKNVSLAQESLRTFLRYGAQALTSAGATLVINTFTTGLYAALEVVQLGLAVQGLRLKNSCDFSASLYPGYSLASVEELHNHRGRAKSFIFAPLKTTPMARQPDHE